MLDKAKETGAKLAPWVEAGLKAVTDTIGYLGKLVISEFGYGIDPPQCDGDIPSWAGQSRQDPDKDILLRCDETAARSVDSAQDDFGLKLTVNRTYALTLKPSRDDMFGPSPEHISVDEADWPTNVEDLAAKFENVLVNPNSIFLPPASTTSLRIPFLAMPGELRRSPPEPGAAHLNFEVQRTTSLNYEVDW